MRVLVVGDDPGLGEVLARGLRGEGHAVDIESRVADADAALAATSYDLLVLDIDLNGGLGLQRWRHVRTLLLRPNGHGRLVLEVGGVRLDAAAHRVWREGTLVALTPREFSLLQYLMTRAGEVVSRADCVEHVWGNHQDDLSNVVDVHVGSLRRKFARTGHPAPIQTVRGLGYRMA